jgi:L-tyrosine isonitrile synthase
MFDTSANYLEREILQIVMNYRRSPVEIPCLRQPCTDCMAPHLLKVSKFISRGEPIHFVLPAFPAKSANLGKVLGNLPDMAERLALNFLEYCCRRIKVIYPPGALITICSDGRVFSDLVRVGEQDVTSYLDELKTVVKDLKADSLDLFSLDNAFDTDNYDEQRCRLILRYAKPIDELRSLVKNGSTLLPIFNGIARFLFEDLFALDGCNRSRNAIRYETKAIAYRMIQRSMAWSSLIAERFPDSIRLSIHPQYPHSEKIGIYLMETLDNWLSPWHGVAVDIGGKFILMKRHEAESLGASLIWLKGRPSYFILGGSEYIEQSEHFAQAL